MKLESIKIKNFRNYNGEHEIVFSSDLTAFIGKNDAGKSTVFDALNVFLNEAKPDLEDLSVGAEEREIVISCVFSDFPKEVVIDSTASTNLKDEYLLNKKRFYEVIKKFKYTEKTITGPDIYIKAHYPTKQGLDNLHTLTIDVLKQRGEERGVKPSDKRKSNLWRKALWDSEKDLQLNEKDLKVEEFEKKAKSIYENLEAHYPLFFLFKSDRQTSDSDAEAKDPIQLAVKEAQKEYDVHIDELRQKIQERVEQVANRALEKLKEMAPRLAEKLKPVLKSPPKWSFDYKIEDERGVALNKRGSGTRRLVLLNFFRAEAERKSEGSERNIVYAIEEPEASQHPDNQKIIIDSLLNLARDEKRQVFISTHSPELLEKVPQNSICFINSETEELIITYGEQALFLAADSLGIFSGQKFGSAKMLVLVESMADCIFLEHAASSLRTNGNINQNFQEAKILPLPLGGKDAIRIWIENNKAEDLGLKYATLLDSDRDSDDRTNVTLNEQRTQDWRDQGIMAFCTKKKEIENYINCALTGCTYGNHDNAKNIIASTNNISEGKVIKNYWPQMTAEQIIESSKYTDEVGSEKIEILEILSEILDNTSD